MNVNVNSINNNNIFALHTNNNNIAVIGIVFIVILRN